MKWYGSIRYVYFIQLEDNNNYIKIGQSKHPIKRIREMQYASEHQITTLLIVKSLNCSGITEKKLHKKFNDFHVGNEWFMPCNELYDYISLLKSRGFAESKHSISRDLHNLMLAGVS